METMNSMLMTVTPSSRTRAFTIARLRAAAGVIGGSGIATGANSLGTPAPGSVPDLN